MATPSLKEAGRGTPELKESESQEGLPLVLWPEKEDNGLGATAC